MEKELGVGWVGRVRRKMSDGKMAKSCGWCWASDFFFVTHINLLFGVGREGVSSVTCCVVSILILCY